MEKVYTPCGIEVHKLSPPCRVVYEQMTDEERDVDEVRAVRNFERLYIELFGGKN